MSHCDGCGKKILFGRFCSLCKREARIRQRIKPERRSLRENVQLDRKIDAWRKKHGD